jgi:hypothetical protein
MCWQVDLFIQQDQDQLAFKRPSHRLFLDRSL